MAFVKRLMRQTSPKITMTRKIKDFGLDYTVHSSVFKALTC
ncbi:hypothetical protein SAMN04515695_2476 [Pseudovibrio sp. Tun.PSC04-5.I4]|nr:hypothetical protein SAMN04515695_2476 [Pseudovibrio sp. Tun.PSC04-5.I4]